MQSEMRYRLTTIRVRLGTRCPEIDFALPRSLTRALALAVLFTLVDGDMLVALCVKLPV